MSKCTAESYGDLSPTEEEDFLELLEYLSNSNLGQNLKLWARSTDGLLVNQYGNFGSIDFSTWVQAGFANTGRAFTRRIGKVILRQNERSKVITDQIRKHSMSSLFFDEQQVVIISIPKVWHPSWTGINSPSFQFAHLIREYAPEINRWRKFTTAAEFPEILQNPNTGEYQTDDWINNLFGYPVGLTAFMTLMKNLAKNHIDVREFHKFWAEFSNCQLFPYLNGDLSPDLLTQPRPASGTVRSALPQTNPAQAIQAIRERSQQPRVADIDQAIGLIISRFHEKLQATEDKKLQLARANSILLDLTLANKIREYWPSLLPAPLSLMDLLGADPNFVYLVMFLITFAEVKLGRTALQIPLPPNTELPAAFDKAATATMSRLSLDALILHDPRIRPEERAKKWRNEAFGMMFDLADLQGFVMKDIVDFGFANNAGGGQSDLMFDQLTEKVNADADFKIEVFTHAKKKAAELGLPYTILDLPQAKKALFSVQSAVGQAVALSVNDKPGLAAQTLTALAAQFNKPEIVNERVLQALKVYDQFPGMLKLAKPAEIDNLLEGYGDNLFCKLAVKQGMLQKDLLTAAQM